MPLPAKRCRSTEALCHLLRQVQGLKMQRPGFMEEEEMRYEEQMKKEGNERMLRDEKKREQAGQE